jgi:glutathione synthase/RimK-type ligase-like ATP-grasp enzyme
MSASKFIVSESNETVPTRIGVAALTRIAFAGGDLAGQWNALLERYRAAPADSAALMDLSVIAQLTSDPQSGANLQAGALVMNSVYRTQSESKTPTVRLLAIAGAADIGGNIPVEFLLGDSDVELITLYVAPGLPMPEKLPAHDVALVTIGHSDAMIETLEEVEDFAPAWPRPLLNDPAKIFELERDRLHANVSGIPGLAIPKTARISRETLDALRARRLGVSSLLPDASFPIIVRPVDSHAGHGLEKIENEHDIETYLAEHEEPEFFISPFIDYASIDGLFRKYRIVFIDGQPYACHMAIAREWRVWYLNADMEQSAAKREEEARFMANFDSGFAARHSCALHELAARVGLDYFGIDCAETKDGALLLFEAETAMIVHDMDPPDVYPYKLVQMRKLFGAFCDMIRRRAKTLAKAA